MKVLLCSNTFASIGNGPTKFARLLYESNCEGLVFHVLSEDIQGESSQRLHKCLVKIPSLLFWTGPFFRMIAYYLKARDLNKEHRFDYFIYNNAIFGSIHALFSSRTIGMINDDYLVGEMEGGTRETYYQNLRRHIFRILESFSIRHHALILTNSKYLNQVYQRKYPKFHDKFRVLYKGTLFKALKSNEIHHKLSLATKPIKILFVKNNYVLGGLENLFRAIQKIDASFLVTVVGPDDKMESSIRQLVQRGNTELRFLGRQTQDVVYEEMLKHHVFCVPSYMEALGVANMEALSVGIPVVTTRTGGIPEVVSDGKAAFLTLPGSVDSLREGLLECIVDRELRSEKLKIGLRDVRAFHFDNTLVTLKAILEAL